MEIHHEHPQGRISIIGVGMGLERVALVRLTADLRIMLIP